MGAYHTGSCFWSTDEGAVLWTALARVAGGLCTCGASCLPGSGLSLWRRSLWSWAGSPLSVVGPQGWLFPCLRSRCPAVSLSDRCSGSELVCACVGVCLSGYLWGWEGWYVLSFFLASVRHFVLLLKYERCHINKTWFDLLSGTAIPTTRQSCSRLFSF